jgi:hypothetical protein
MLLILAKSIYREAVCRTVEGVFQLKLSNLTIAFDSNNERGKVNTVSSFIGQDIQSDHVYNFFPKVTDI